MNAILQMSPWRRAFWSIPVTLFLLLLWPVPAAHAEAHPLLVVVRAQSPALYVVWVWGGRIAPGICFFFGWQVLASIVNLFFVISRSAVRVRSPAPIESTTYGV